MSDVRLLLRQSVLDVQELQNQIVAAQQQIMAEQERLQRLVGARDALFTVFLDGRDIPMQKAWDDNLDNLREDDGNPPA